MNRRWISLQQIGSSSLEDHYEPAPILMGVDPTSFMADIGCVHRTVRLWNGSARNDPLTPAEAAARQIEAADALVFPGPATTNGHRAAGVAALASQLNSHALLVRPTGTDDADVELPPSLFQPAAHGIADEWRSRLEPVTVPRSRRSSDQGVNSVLWRARRPLHPERLDAVSPQRRILASWFWHDYYGERRNEITFTGTDLDEQRIRPTLVAALLTDAELSMGRDGWRRRWRARRVPPRAGRSSTREALG
ncbi:hypothetical protein [Streptomyces nigrescens]